MDSVDLIKRLNQTVRKGKSDQTTRCGYIRTFYKVAVHWSAIEEVLLSEMMENESERSRSALVRRAIHERAMRTLGSEKYYKIIERPSIE